MPAIKVNCTFIIMKEMGLGGFFMHFGTGLETEYQGKEWFEDIEQRIRISRTILL